MNVNFQLFGYIAAIVLSILDIGYASEIFTNKTLRQATRVASKLVYDHQKRDLPKPWTQIQEAGKKSQLVTDKFTSSDHDIVDAFVSKFDQSLSGSVYSLKHSDMYRAIMVAFPGSFTALDWAKNFVTRDSLYNIQEHIWKDTDLFWKSDPHIFTDHINHHRQKISGDDALDIYFIGHSRGGANAIVAGQLFQDRYVSQNKSIFGNIKSVNVVSYCSPRVSKVADGLFSKSLFSNSKVNFINFLCPSDFVSYLPYNWPLNPGTIIPFRRQPSANIVRNHKIPTREEMECSVDAYPAARHSYPDKELALYLVGAELAVAGMCQNTTLLRNFLQTQESEFPVIAADLGVKLEVVAPSPEDLSSPKPPEDIAADLGVKLEVVAPSPEDPGVIGVIDDLIELLV